MQFGFDVSFRSKYDCCTSSAVQRHDVIWVFTLNGMVCLGWFCDSVVKLDALLHDVLVAKGDYIETLRWDDLISRCLNKMTPVHCVTFDGAETQVHRGRLELIELDVVQRASNKKVITTYYQNFF